MTATTTETLTVDGVLLNTLAKNVESLTGRLRTPAIQGTNITIPSRNGAIYTRTKTYDQGSMTLPMWVRGCDDNGNIPFNSTSRKMFYKNLDQLTRLFRVKTRLIDVRHKLPDGTTRQAFCEVTDAIDFSTDAWNPVGKFSVIMDVPGSFWHDIDTRISVNTIDSSGTVLDLTEFVGTTAPLEDLVFTVTGPVTNFKMLATEDGVQLDPEISFQYNGIIGAGETLTVDCASWSVTGGGGLTVDFSKVQHKGNARYMVITPEDMPQVRVNGSALTGASSLSVTGRRKFMIG